MGALSALGDLATPGKVDIPTEHHAEVRRHLLNEMDVFNDGSATTTFLLSHPLASSLFRDLTQDILRNSKHTSVGFGLKEKLTVGEPMDRDSKLWFGKERQFDKAFPQLEQALISYYEVGDGIYKDTFKKEYNNPHPIKELLMRCSNPRCKRGGYEIDGEISRMVMRNELELETVLFCPGDEGSPKRDRGIECMNKLHVRLKLTYKTENAKPNSA
jgi:hypothetical protein